MLLRSLGEVVPLFLVFFCFVFFFSPRKSLLNCDDRCFGQSRHSVNFRNSAPDCTRKVTRVSFRFEGILVARWHIVSLHFCCKNSCNNPLWREGDENATDEKYDLKVWYGLFVFTSVFHLKFNKFVILVLSYRICDLLLLAFLIGVENSEPAFGRREAGSRLQEPARGKSDGLLTGIEILEIQDNGTTGLGESWACNIITKHWIYPV